MLPCKSSRLRFSAWSTASTILVYDAESSSISDGSNIQGLLQKFRNEGFSPDKKLAWLKGGFVSIWRERPDLVVSGPENVDEDDEEGDQDAPSHLSLSGRMAPTVLPPFVLRTKNLPMSAFTSTSTTSQLPTSMGSHYSPVRLTSTSSSVCLLQQRECTKSYNCCQNVRRTWRAPGRPPESFACHSRDAQFEIGPVRVHVL
jgi:hypothetical protein